MRLKILLLPFMVLFFIGCAATVSDTAIVKSYKSVNNYKSVNMVRGNQNAFLGVDTFNKFDDMLFNRLYNSKNTNNFVPGDQLHLKYEVLNAIKMKQHMADFGTYFGKGNSQFEVLFTIYDKYHNEIGLYHVNIDVEYWLFPQDKLLMDSAFAAASDTISQHLRLNYLQ